MSEILLNETQEKEDLERRIKGFQDEYKELVEKYQIDFTAQVVPKMSLLDLKKKK